MNTYPLQSMESVPGSKRDTKFEEAVDIITRADRGTAVGSSLIEVGVNATSLVWAASLLLEELRDTKKKCAKDVQEARAWAIQMTQEISKNRVVTCVYCGFQYPDGTPTYQDEQLTAHIGVCEKHPMSKLKAVVDDLLQGKHSCGLTWEEHLCPINNPTP